MMTNNNHKSYLDQNKPIPGTQMFDGRMSRKGFSMNKMFYSFNEADARQEFLADQAAYCDRYGLSKVQKQAVIDKDILTLLDEGASIYHLAKFAGVFGMNMQDIGALQTGVSVEEFHEKLRKAGE